MGGDSLLQDADPDPTEDDPGASRPAVGLRDGATVLAVLVGSQILGGFGIAAAYGFFFVATGGDATDSSGVRALQTVAMPVGIAGGMIASALGLLAYGYWSLRGAERAARRRAVGAVRAPTLHLVVALATGITLAVAYVVGIQLFWTPEPIVNPGPMTQMGTTPGWPQWTWALLGLAFSPWIEEFVFRGQLLAALDAAWGRFAGATLTTLLFLGLHASELLGFPPGALGITAMSLCALAARRVSGSFWPAMFVHFGYNALLASGVLIAGAVAR
ncbi:MAG: CPBP family intramembrane glutamic endopeptidase [Myxococcota bacterium]